MRQIGFELLENDNEALLKQLFEIYDKDPDPAFLNEDLYCGLAEEAVEQKRFDILNTIFKIGKSCTHDFKDTISYLDTVFVNGDTSAEKIIKDNYYKIAVIAANNGLYGIVDVLKRRFHELNLEAIEDKK
jgi:hypothetical protein